ncbi:hypothetical protein BG844_11710 [Couchioplanes caeruleus subsp. caeruleus]|uniref:Uncharacterized protein n=1 Tax=Couchioplanes caeruleus subsp. caeruleus TaxID=56427 RepID=A0A1K0FML3_9ACTN|nr:hypothetical protein BG844_11710 [Couchioplanes caeruleus subsp. caeruleus]
MVNVIVLTSAGVTASQMAFPSVGVNKMEFGSAAPPTVRHVVTLAFSDDFGVTEVRYSSADCGADVVVGRGEVG